jgi:hypothetical protein
MRKIEPKKGKPNIGWCLMLFDQKPLNNLRITKVKKNSLTRIVLVMFISALLSGIASADENKYEWSRNLRVGYITIKNEAGNNINSSAVGGKVTYASPLWNDLSAGGTLYVTKKLFSDENKDFFDSQGNSYAILGEAYLKVNFGNTQTQAGRFEIDTPHVDTDDTRMVPNTFSGIVVSNTDIKDTTIYLTHFDEWAGSGSEKPEEFIEMNGDDGVIALGAIYKGFENIALQTWYYHGSNFASLFYAEAMVEVDNLMLGTQFGSQSDKTNDNSGPDGKVYGVMASYAINNFAVHVAYNTVSGTIFNGFGGGPFFSNAALNTINGIIDESAFAVGIDYTSVDGFTLGILNVNFGEHMDETDYFASYEFSNNMTLDITYHHMHSNGDMVLAMFNYDF